MNLSFDYPQADRGRIVVWGLMASLPFGGMIWQALHYLVGLRRLGFDVWYVEDSDRAVYDPDKLWPTLDYLPNVEHLSRHMKSVGLGDRWVFRPPEVWDTCLGARDIDGLSRLYSEADAVINLCGAQELHRLHHSIRKLIYLQTDPTADQVRVASGDQKKIDELDAYDHLFTYGENIDKDGCQIPVERYRWHTTRPPVIVDWWRSQGPPPADASLTTITNWKRFPKKAVRWNGQTWSWSKQDEIRRFIDLPSKSRLPIELALGGIVTDEDLELLRSHGWRLRSAKPLSDPLAYRDYVQGSIGEFTIAKAQYVVPYSGWFSDRSACYLAAGRPVITQNTGFETVIPTGEGLFAFNDMDDAIAGIDAIAADPGRQMSAATELADSYFGSEIVLTDLLKRAGLVA